MTVEVTSKSSSSRNYSDRTLKILWGRAAGRCAVPECRIELFADATDYDPIVVIGDIAHIEASSNTGPRANKTKAASERDQYENLILLCKNCHTRFDGQKNTNTVEIIRQLKAGHEAWVRASLPERGRSATGWNVFILQGEHPIDPSQTGAALAPDFQAGQPLVFTADPSRQSWTDTLQEMTGAVDNLFAATDPFDHRFAIFPLAPVSACISLGYLLTSRPRVRLFQYHRDSQTWRWPDKPASDNGIAINGLGANAVDSAGKVAICFDLSAQVHESDLPTLPGGFLATVRLSVPSPSTSWLQTSTQLNQLGVATRETLEAISRLYPRATEWHIFYAGPAPGAVKVGQQFNPTMVPRVQLYEFSRSRTPAYLPTIMLGGTPA